MLKEKETEQMEPARKQISDEEFCRDCVFSPETCGKDVKKCRKEAENIYFQYFHESKYGF